MTWKQLRTEWFSLAEKSNVLHLLEPLAKQVPWIIIRVERTRVPDRGDLPYYPDEVFDFWPVEHVESRTKQLSEHGPFAPWLWNETKRGPSDSASFLARTQKEGGDVLLAWLNVALYDNDVREAIHWDTYKKLRDCLPKGSYPSSNNHWGTNTRYTLHDSSSALYGEDAWRIRWSERQNMARLVVKNHEVLDLISRVILHHTTNYVPVRISAIERSKQ